jgi:transposase
MKRLVGDELWELVEPLLPPEPDKPKGERPRISARSVLEGIVYRSQERHTLQGMLPKEPGCIGVSCWGRLRDWQKAGVWHGLRRLLLDKLGRLGLIDWSRASVDSASIPAKRGESRPARIPQTAGVPAPSATSSWTEAAYHSPPCSREPRYTTRRPSRAR